MDKYLYAAVFFVFVGFVYWYSGAQTKAGYNECKAELVDARARIDSAVSLARSEGEEKLARFRKQAEARERKYKNDLAKYRNNPEVEKWSKSAVPDVISDNLWLRNSH